MTLIELLVCIFLIGAIVTVLSAALTVTFNQHDATEARLDVARWEQSLATWLPADLSSATNVDATTAAPAPCASAACTFGSNVLQLGWNTDGSTTTVSYRYGRSADGETFILTRVVCDTAGCASQVVLRDLAAPPSPWSPGDEVPADIVDVAAPNLVDDPDPDSIAQRVIITVNGAHGLDGVDRSSTVIFTAGGSRRGILPTPTYSGPSFLDARSRCGGAITLVVDESKSIGNADTDVENAVRTFIDTFSGTPTRLQIIEFNGIARAVGLGSAWAKYHDMSEPTEVASLKGELDIDQDALPVGTNWEDALFRTFYASDGQTHTVVGDPNAPMPDLVVFFTDGQPTSDRRAYRSDTAAVNPPSAPFPFEETTEPGRPFSPRAWYRADYIADQFRGTKMIGVGIGTNFAEATRVSENGWPTTDIPNEAFLGDLVSGGDPSKHGTAASGNYVVRDYELNGNSWGDISNADLLVSDDLGNLSSALSQIALAECGGTLTVQTRTTAGTTAPITVGYQVGTEIGRTSAIQKAVAFDIDGPTTDVEVIPESLEGSGYEAQSWSCKAAGVPYPSSPLGAPADGIRVSVGSNDAVSCTMVVAESP